jgi:uncharacterized protein YbjT (DUF2867 family)
MRIAVAGGTGVVGRLVVDRLRERGHEVVVLARAEGVDLATGTGLAGRLEGVDAVIDATSVATLKTAEAVEFFGSVTRNLLAEEQRAGVGHHVALSIVGIDGAETGYYAGKVEQERIVKAGPVPWTILRATQFHEFGGQMADRGKLGPIHLVPQMLSAPVAAGEVADLLVDLASGSPKRDTVEIGGPGREQVVDMARRVLRARGSRRAVLPVWVPGAAGRSLRSGDLVPTRADHLGKETFDEWLVRRYPAAGTPAAPLP